MLAAAAVPLLPASYLLLPLAALVVAALVAAYPSLAAYLYIGVTPLVAGIDRGSVIPLLRPNEALAVLVGGALLARGAIALRSGELPALRVGRTDRSILALAVLSSIVPLAWMVVRHQQIEHDDLLYALQIWKFYGVYLLIRFSVRTEREVRRCLWISMAVGAVVAVIAILQSLQLFGVAGLLSHYYAPYGSTQALLNNRGGSTLSLPIAEADLMIFNLAIAVGLLLNGDRHRMLLTAASLMFVLGVIASGEFSAYLELAIAVVTIAVASRRIREVAKFVPAIFIGSYVLRPVLQRRLMGFHTVSGLPLSWYQRLTNLRTYFWPQLFSHFNFVLGVRPAARVATATMATGYVWIESGYTWLLWGGGIPLLLAFFYFVGVNLPDRLVVARARDDAVGVAALAVVVALVAVTVLMILDSHLTYRGSGDLLFALLALSSTRIPAGRGDDGAVSPSRSAPEISPV